MRVELTKKFERDFKKLPKEHRKKAEKELHLFISECEKIKNHEEFINYEFPPKLRVKKMQNDRNKTWEWTWNFQRPAGRGTFELSTMPIHEIDNPVEIDEPIITLRRIGDHKIVD